MDNQHITHQSGIVPLWLLGIAALALSLFIALPAWSQDQAIPQLDNWVVDTTNTFDTAQKNALAERLAAFEKSQGAQLFVLMVPSTEPEDIAQYTRRVYDKWKVGRKNVDDGVLLVVAKEDRRLRIEVGYGLEGAITDLQAGRIIREFIAPYFMQDEYVAGINEGVDKIIVLVEGEDLPPPVERQAMDTDEDGPLAMLIPLAFFAFVLPPLGAALVAGIFSFFLFWSLPIALLLAAVASIISLVAKAFGRNHSATNSSQASSRGSSIGGFGGGSGFGGGGGGSSGGGGASGGW